MQDLASVFADTNVSVRTVLDAVGDVWFSCTDVAKAVGYADAPAAVTSLMPDRKELSEIEPPEKIRGVGFSGVFGNQWKQAKVINLEMLNDFLMDSGKPAAKAAPPDAQRKCPVVVEVKAPFLTSINGSPCAWEDILLHMPYGIVCYVTNEAEWLHVEPGLAIVTKYNHDTHQYMCVDGSTYNYADPALPNECTLNIATAMQPEPGTDEYFGTVNSLETTHQARNLRVQLA